MYVGFPQVIKLHNYLILLGMPPREQKAPPKKPEDEDLTLRREALEYQIQLVQRQQQRSKFETERMKRELVEIDQKLVDEGSALDAEALRAYRHTQAMQSDLIQRIENKQEEVALLQSKLASSRDEVEALLESKAAMLAEKNRQLNEQKQRMEDITIEFGEALKATLEQMAANIDAIEGHTA